MYGTILRWLPTTTNNVTNVDTERPEHGRSFTSTSKDALIAVNHGSL